jgi:hypothetical protein
MDFERVFGLAPAPFAPLAARRQDPERPARVDWRDRFGANWVTTVPDQTGESCAAQSVVGTLEAMVRIEHRIWVALSVSDIRGQLRKSPHGWGNRFEAIDVVRAYGVCDDTSLIDPVQSNYEALRGVRGASPDRDARTVTVRNVVRMKTQRDGKRWLDTMGPFAAGIDVTAAGGAIDPGFASLGTKVYSGPASGASRPDHCILVVGYDDEEGVWICRNSWGAGWGDAGFFRVAYGKAGIDDAHFVGMFNTVVGDALRARHAAGGILVRGTQKYAHTLDVFAERGGQIVRFTNERDPSTPHWTSNASVPGVAPIDHSPAAVVSTFHGTLELVARDGVGIGWWSFNGAVSGPAGDERELQWEAEQKPVWNGRGFALRNLTVAGRPGFLQDPLAAPGDLEFVVRENGGKLTHTVVSSDLLFEVRTTTVAGSAIGASGPAFARLRDGTRIAVATERDGDLVTYRGTATPAGVTWTLESRFGGGGEGSPVMFVGLHGAVDERTDGHLELFVPHDGQVHHYWCRADDRQWKHAASFGPGAVEVVGACQAGSALDIEVVLKTADGLEHWRRTDAGWARAARIV